MQFQIEKQKNGTKFERCYTFKTALSYIYYQLPLAHNAKFFK